MPQIGEDGWLPPYRRVLEDARIELGITDEDMSLIELDVNCFLNSSADAGRPSDAARSVIWSYRTLGRDAYVTQWHASRGRA